MAIAHYIDGARLRLELGGISPAVLSDDQALVYIRQADALIDRALGAGYGVQSSGPQLGRKISEAGVRDWQWEALQDAAASMAARLYQSPDLLGPRFRSVSGPEFSYSGPLGPVLGAGISNMLEATGLLPTGARASS